MTQIYPCKNFLIPRTQTSAFQHESIGAWAACSQCAELIDVGRWAELTDRAFTNLLKQHCVPHYAHFDVREQFPRNPSAVQREPRQGELRMQIRNNWGELIGEINSGVTDKAERIITNTIYHNGNPVMQNISVRDYQGKVRTTTVCGSKILT